MAKLVDLARVVRSKNAGALQLTIDLIFEDMASFARVRDSGALTPSSLAQICASVVWWPWPLPAIPVAIVTFPAGPTSTRACA